MYNFALCYFIFHNNIPVNICERTCYGNRTITYHIIHADLTFCFISSLVYFSVLIFFSITVEVIWYTNTTLSYIGNFFQPLKLNYFFWSTSWSGKRIDMLEEKKKKRKDNPFFSPMLLSSGWLQWSIFYLKVCTLVS